MASRPLICNGLYRIKSDTSNTYLDCSNDGSVTAQPHSSGPSQQWIITSAGDGDYELQSAANRQNLRVDDQNQLICRPTLRTVTWTIEPRGFEAYVIGNAADALAIQLPKNGPVTAVIRNSGGRQRWLIEADTIQAPRSNKIAGFPTGIYFEIRARGSNDVLLTYGFSNEDGAQIQLYGRPSGGLELGAAAFFIDSTGALIHSSGLNVDIVDNVPVLRRRRPVLNTPNLWSHPFPQFSYRNSQIQIDFNRDPALPSCSDQLYPNKSWLDSHFVLARDSEQGFHMHPPSDFQPWAPRVPFTLSHWGTLANFNCGVVVEPWSGDAAIGRTQWDIIPFSF